MTQVAIKTASNLTVEKLLESGKDQLQKVLPQVIQSDRFIRVALTEIRKSLPLQKCNPVSVCAAVMQAAQLGLEFGSTLGHAYLIPYGAEATLQVGYRGLMHLARRSGAVKAFEARVVYADDEFSYEFGLYPNIKHIPKNTGAITHIYAIATLTDGSKVFDVMTKAAIDDHRAKYASRNKDTWEKAYEEMAKKTVIKRLIKSLPITPEVADALEIESRFEPQEEERDSDKLTKTMDGQLILSDGEAQAAQISLGRLYAECDDAGISTDDLILEEDASPAQVLAATQILNARITEWKKKSTAN